MVKLVVNLAIAAWLLISAFVLPQSSVTAWNAMIVAVLVAAVALFAFVVDRPGLKYAESVLAVWLFASTMFLPHESLGTVLHDAAVAVVLALVSLLPSHRWAHDGEPHARPA